VSLPIPLSDDAKLVLSEVREQPMFGYMLLSRTSLDIEHLAVAARQLVEAGLMRAEGNLGLQQLEKTYFWVPPDVKGYADFISGKFMS
jgi:hypothetical protein